MRYADMNERQKKAFRNIVHASDWIIGGLENAEMDGSSWATEELQNHNKLVERLYNAAVNEYYDGNGGVYFGESAKSYIKDIKFCGREWLLERCEKRIRKLGY